MMSALQPSFVVPASVAPGAPVALAGTPGTSAPVSAYTWSFGDGQTATGQSVSHSYSAAGSYWSRWRVDRAREQWSGEQDDRRRDAGFADARDDRRSGRIGGGKSGTAKTCRPVVSGRAGVKEQVCTTTTVSSIKRLSCKPAGTSGAKRTAEACRTVKLLVTRRRTCTQTRAAGATAWSQRCSSARVVSSRATG